jgi:hypothetical protein
MIDFTVAWAALDFHQSSFGKFAVHVGYRPDIPDPKKHS